MAHQLHAFTMKPSCQIGSSTSLKLKTLIQAYVVRALTYAKTLVIELINSKNDELRRRRKRKKKKSFATIKMCFSRPSSHVRPMSHAYYDSTWNSMIDPSDHEGDDDVEAGVLSGYLQWLEEKEIVDGEGASEIDRLAEKFIERCHEKFRLEKQESYRRYQEMLARSI